MLISPIEIIFLLINGVYVLSRIAFDFSAWSLHDLETRLLSEFKSRKEHRGFLKSFDLLFLISWGIPVSVEILYLESILDLSDPVSEFFCQLGIEAHEKSPFLLLQLIGQLLFFSESVFLVVIGSCVNFFIDGFDALIGFFVWEEEVFEDIVQGYWGHSQVSIEDLIIIFLLLIIIEHAPSIDDLILSVILCAVIGFNPHYPIVDVQS